jgi:signal transduction histidine kinase
MNATEPDFRLKRLTGEFENPATEHAFRLATFRDTRLLNRIVFSIAAFSSLAHIGSDYLLYGLGETFYAVGSLRLAAALILLLVFPITATPRSIPRTDAGIFGLQAFILMAFYLGFLLIPTTYLYERISVQSVSALLMLIAQYLFIANRLPYSVVAGIASSILYFGVTIATARLNTSAFALEVFVHVIANMLGIFTIYRSGALKRRQYALSSTQAGLNRRLEAQGRRLEAQAAELARARDAALEANRAKSEFLAYMSHELRSPMNAILGFSEMIKHEVFGRVNPPKYREYVDDIHGSAAHLLSLINDILDLSKAEAGKLQLNEGAVDLAAAIEAAHRLVAVRAEASHIALRVHVAPNLPPLRGDGRMVKQMVLNLLSNAIKFTPVRGSVAVDARRDEAGGIVVSVSDTGPGIAEGDIPRILEAYGRTDAVEKTAVEGTGLGLPLVKTMIELHGGTLAIESRPGAGSTFTLRFPPGRAGLAKAA